MSLALKAECIDKGIDKVQRSLAHKINKGSSEEIRESALTAYYEWAEKEGELFYEAIRINRANQRRSNRLKYRILSMLLDGDCYFITFTFTDKVLESDYNTRRRYVRRFLKEYSNYYIANIDYGSKNGREHYHAVLRSDRQINFADWTHGNIDFKKVRYSYKNKSAECLSKYVNKLHNHAIKDTVKRNHVIYGSGNWDLLLKYGILKLNGKAESD